MAASFNTAVRRISRANSDESLDNVSLHYNTFVVPPPGSPCPSLRKSWPSQNSKQDDEHSSTEMLALVKPLQRHKEQMKQGERFNERDTLHMAANRDDTRDLRDSRDGYDSPTYSISMEDDGFGSLTETIISLNHMDDDDLDPHTSGEGKSPQYPLDECFGSVLVSTRKFNEKMVCVLVSQLRGVPWVGSSDGLSVQVKVAGSPKSQWLFLPNAKGPEVPVQREVNLKLGRHTSKTARDEDGKSSREHWVPLHAGAHKDLLLVSVWPGCGSPTRYSAIGHSLVPLSQDHTATRVFGLYGQTKLHRDLGSLEVSLISSSTSSSSSSRSRGLLLKILRAHGLEKPSFNWIAKKATKTLPDKGRMDVWCSVALWIDGEKAEKEVIPKVPMPVTGDPSFKASCTFFVPKKEQHKATLVIKVHCGRSLHEVTVGRLVLGPLLYLGSHKHPPLLPMDTSCPRPVTLSHWGRSFNTHYPVTAWHRLTL